MIFDRAIRRLKNESGQVILTLDDPKGWNAGIDYGSSKLSAMKISAVNRCVEAISNSMSKIPFFVMHRETKERADHRIMQPLKLRPNEAMAPSVFKKLIETHRLCWGNAYIALIRSPSTGYVQEMIPLPPDYVTPHLDEDGLLWYGFVNPRNGERRKIRSYDVVHLKAFSEDGIKGISVLERAAQTIRSAHSVQQYEGKLYSQNARPAGVLKVASMLEKGAKDKIREEWEQVHSGVDNQFRIAVLDLGMEYQQISLSPKDTQFVESKEVTVGDIARFFGVPMYMLMAGNQSYNANNQNSIEYVKNTLAPILVQYEEEMTYKILSDLEIARGWEIKGNLNAELRGDVEARGTWYKNMREAGAFSVNDIRALEDQAGVPGGDVRLASLNYVPLDLFEELSKNRNEKGGRG